MLVHTSTLSLHVLSLFIKNCNRGQSSTKKAWLLVYYYVRCYFKELHKVRASAQIASNMSFASDRAGVTL